MQFNQITPTVPELYAATDIAVAGTILYLLPKGTSAAPPTTIAFADSWTAGGSYVFLEQGVESGHEQAFATAAWQALSGPPVARFGWLHWTEPAGGNGGNASVAALIDVDGNATSGKSEFQMENLNVILASGTPVTPDPATFAFTFGQPGSPSPVSIEVNGRPGAVPGGTLTLPFTDHLSGCLQFAVTFAEEDVAMLSGGLQFYYASSSGPIPILTALVYPVFNDTLTLYANIDPIAPAAPARTFFAFTGTDAGQPAGPAEAPPVKSYYSSTAGKRFSLHPLTGTSAPTQFAALVLTAATQVNGTVTYSLVPAGDFALSTEGGGAASLMAGLSGVESFAVNVTQASVLSFFPGQNAFAAAFAPGEGTTAPALTPPAPLTTSFACLSEPSASVTYFAQPDHSVLFRPGAAVTQSFQPLAPMILPAATLAAPTAKASFPLIPYAGATPSPAQPASVYQQMESQVISPMRRNTLAATSASKGQGAGAANASVTATTPQGLVVGLTSDLSQWASLTLAQTQPLPGQPEPLVFSFSSLSARVPHTSASLQSALQTNKLFLVISDAAVMQAYLEAAQARINLADWVFDLNPASTWGSGKGATAGTIMIVKFSDLPIAQLVQQPGAWTDAAVFNQNPAATAQTINSIIGGATGDVYDAFNNAVNNPQWNGILILNGGIGNIPATLTGLMAGIDESLFYGHHVGIELSSVAVGGGAVTMNNTSIFALIDYEVPALVNNGAPYQFQVRSLTVLFENSAIADFNSTIELQVNQLFNEPATLQGSLGQNILQLSGAYQSNNDGGTYSFTTTGESVFEMTSAVLNAVEFTGGQFVTVGTTGGVTTSKFVFWAVLDFQALKNFDVFSFGSAAGASPAGLSVGNLAIVLTQPNASAGDAASPPQFAFDASRLSIDIAGSTSRPGSFYPNFPLTVSGMTQAPAGAGSPSTFGYMSVQTPLDQSSLDSPWYSLDFDLNLGSAGALAALSGFTAAFTVAWSPNLTGPYTVFTGLKLPGSNGSSHSISIEGLFDITFKTLEVATASDNPDAYVLVLYDIGFSFLSFTFPPSGQMNFVLFGDPNAVAGAKASSSAGWYAAYAKGGN